MIFPMDPLILANGMEEGRVPRGNQYRREGDIEQWGSIGWIWKLNFWGIRGRSLGGIWYLDKNELSVEITMVGL